MAFRKPPVHPHWEQMKPAERRAHQLDQERVDKRMAQLLQKLPAASDETMGQIKTRVNALDDREKEAFWRHVNNAVDAGVNRDQFRKLQII